MLLLFIKRKGDALTCYHGATDAYMLSGEFRILAQGIPLKKISIQFGKSFSNSVTVVKLVT
jgi:hypothetical protein